MIVIADGKVVIDVVLESGEVAKGVANVDSQLSGLEGAGERGAIGIGKIVTALGLVAAGAKAIGLVKDSISSAFSRIDTMEQFQRVMGVMVNDTDAVNDSMGRMEDFLTGTSMRMDTMANSVQGFVTRGVEIDKATGHVEAWGNAVSFYGDGSSEQFENVSNALHNMVSKGTVGMDQLNRITEAGIPAVEMYADATGKSASEVSEALSNGEISAEQFVDVVSSALMEGTEKFPEVSTAMKDMGMSWGSIMENIGAYIDIGVTDIIQTIDRMLEENGLPDMRTMIDNFAQGFGGMLSTIADKIPAVVNKIKEIYNALDPWLPLLGSVAAAVGGMVFAWSAFNTVKNIINGVKGAMAALNLVMAANPWLLLIGAIIAAAVLVYTYWEPIKEFFVNLWESIKSVGLSIWETLKLGWQTAVEFLQELWFGVVEFFVNLWESIKEVFSSSYTWLNEKTGGAFGQYVEIIQSFLTTAWEIIQSIWSFIKDTFSNALAFLKALVTGDFQGMRDAIDAQMQNAKNLLSNIWNAIKDNIGKKIMEILSNVIAKFQEIKSNIQNKISEAKTALVNKFTEMVTGARDKATEIVTAAQEKFQEVKQAIQDKLEEAVQSVAELVGEMPGKVTEKATEMVSAGKDLILGLVEGIKDMGKDAIEAVTGVVGGVIDKAKDLLSIESPSKLFKEFGGFLSEGLAIGINDEAKQAIKSSQKLAEGVSEGFDPGMDIVSRLRGIKPNISGVTPISATESDSKTVNTTDSTTLNMDGLFNGANFNVNDEQDIPKLAKELGDYIKMSARSKGVIY